MTLEIRLLGPLSVLVDGREATPTAPKPRRVLALLAMSANSVVRNEKIIEELWEDNPPISVTTTLQTYVYQLRKVLHFQVSSPANRMGLGSQPAHASEALHTFSGGYMLSLDNEALDCLRFERLARLGRSRLEAGNMTEASRILREALRLWRGPALVDVSPGSILQMDLLRLEEIRSSALEARIEADLRLGRHHEVLGELIGLVAQYPTHEGFQAKLMVAMYRAGRRSGALHAYQHAREALVSELGIEPSSELQRLHRAILAGELQPAEHQPAALHLG
ncbi:MAG: AfsR/SARP family transcriptional regulator [Actinoplanes sp.]